MTEPPDPSHRTLHDAPAGAVSLREAEEMEDDDGMMEVRMPVASTGEVRNDGDTPLSPGELRGMAEQINAGRVGVFPEHGMSNAMDGGKYSAFEKLGYWANAEIVPGESADDEDLLMATARMPDPNTLPDVGAYRELLGVIKEQARRGVPLSASIGWRDDEDYPGGVDLMEASIVGIGADPRTQTETGTTALARAAVKAGADPDDLVTEVRRAVESMPDDARADYEVGDETVEITPPDYMVNAADLAMQKSDEGLGSDCGTGVGDERADQIRNDEVGPDVVVEIAAYLTSHEEDVTAEGTPDEWSGEEWDDCGNIQYAKWGGLGTGTALEWAQARANAVADARDEDLPYPNRAARNLDDPQFSEGDAVYWEWQDSRVHGRVAGVHEEFTPEDGPTVTGEDGEAVYSIHEWDEEVEAFRRQNVAKPESSLSPSDKEMPAATDDNFQNMADDDTPDEPDGGTTDDEQTAPDDGAETTTRAPEDVTADDLFTFTAMHLDGMDEEDLAEAVDAADASYIGECDPEALADLVSTATGAEYGDVVDAMDALMSEGDGEEPDDEQGDYGDDEEDEEEDDERAAETEEERSVDPDTDTDDDTTSELAERVAELESALEDVRSGEVSVTSPQKEQAAESDAEDGEERAADDETDSEPVSPTAGLGDYRSNR